MPREPREPLFAWWFWLLLLSILVTGTWLTTTSYFQEQARDARCDQACSLRYRHVEDVCECLNSSGHWVPQTFEDSP